jgi:hypothetical protein
MKPTTNDNRVDELLKGAWGAAPQPDFEAWRRRYPEVESNLSVSRAASGAEEQALSRRKFGIAAAALIAVGVVGGLLYVSNGARATSAEILEQLENAKGITWKTTFYAEVVAKDGKSKWIETETRHFAYMRPGLHRDASVDENGKVVYFSITDNANMKQLRISHKRKEATVSELAVIEYSNGPFDWVKKELSGGNLQWVGSKDADGRRVNVFRLAFRDNANGRDWSYDFWLDAKTKQLVVVQVPGSDIFDPAAQMVQNDRRAKEGWSQMTPVASIEFDINTSAELDESEFRLEPPEGYTVHRKERPQVTEQEMINYLGVWARFLNDRFPDNYSRPVSSDRINAIYDKAESERTKVEQALLDTLDRYKSAGLNKMPVRHFMEDHAVPDSFRYLGKGVRLGDKDRIVCWYELKGATTYRAVYGDLTVKDVAADDLPLNVGK